MCSFSSRLLLLTGLFLLFPGRNSEEEKTLRILSEQKFLLARKMIVAWSTLTITWISSRLIQSEFAYKWVLLSLSSPLHTYVCRKGTFGNTIVCESLNCRVACSIDREREEKEYNCGDVTALPSPIENSSPRVILSTILSLFLHSLTRSSKCKGKEIGRVDRDDVL